MGFRPSRTWRSDIFDDDNRIVHDKPDGEDDRQQREQIQREAENLHEKKPRQ